MSYDKFGISGGSGEGFYEHKTLGRLIKSSFMKEWADNYIGEDVNTIIDIGALDGGDSIRFSLWYPNASIYTIEGSKENYENILKNIEGKLNNIKVFNCVMSAEDGIIKFNQVYHPFTGMLMGSIFEYEESHKRNNSLKEVQSIVVESITFDTFCQQNDITSIDIAHIDAEGAGYDIISRMITVLPKMIFIEYDRQDAFINKPTGDDELISLLESKGYKKVLQLVNDYLFVLK